MSDRTPRAFSTDFKERAALRLEPGEQFSALAAELGVRRKLLYDWRKSYRELGAAGLNRKRGPKPGGRRSPPDRTMPAGPLVQAAARMRLASTANPWPPTSPSAMQRRNSGATIPISFDG